MTRVVELNTSANPLYLTLHDDETVDGLKGAYDAASSAAQNVIGLTTTLGTPTIRDNATPLADELFLVENSDSTRAYFFVQGTGTGQGAGASGTFDFQTTVSRYFALINTSAATALVPVQYSPFYSATATAWDTDDLVSRNLRFFWGVQPTSAATISGSLVWYSKVATGADTQVLALTSGGQLQLLDGTAAAPSLSFSGTTSGIFRNAANDLRIQGSNGGANVQLGSSGAGADGYLVSAGTASYVQVAGTGTVTLNGSQVFFNDGAVGTPSMTFAGDTNAGFYRVGNDEVGVQTAGTLGMSWTTVGAFKNNVAAAETGTANAGAATLPGNPRGFLTFVDSGGTSRKIPYYDT